MGHAAVRQGGLPKPKPLRGGAPYQYREPHDLASSIVHAGTDRWPWSSFDAALRNRLDRTWRPWSPVPNSQPAAATPRHSSRSRGGSFESDRHIARKLKAREFERMTLRRSRLFTGSTISSSTELASRCWAISNQPTDTADRGDRYGEPTVIAAGELDGRSKSIKLPHGRPAAGERNYFTMVIDIESYSNASRLGASSTPREALRPLPQKPEIPHRTRAHPQLRGPARRSRAQHRAALRHNRHRRRCAAVCGDASRHVPCGRRAAQELRGLRRALRYDPTTRWCSNNYLLLALEERDLEEPPHGRTGRGALGEQPHVLDTQRGFSTSWPHGDARRTMQLAISLYRSGSPS